MIERNSDEARDLARSAYETLEPFHVIAYFAPGLQQAATDVGLDLSGFYVGARGAPLGPCDASVVSAAFFNFSPSVVRPGWESALGVGLTAVADRRYQLLDDTLRGALGSAVDDPELARLADRYTDIAAGLPLAGRTLASAWARSTSPDAAHLRLWRAVAILREWRGDGHVAALVLAGLDRAQALVFHEARHPDPTVRRRLLGRKFSQLSRGWSDADWDGAVETLVARGVLERADEGGERLTDAGVDLYADVEKRTDAAAAAAWADVDDAAELIAATRPYVKSVIDAGILPGTKNRATPR
ncbi:SCO6745 family protein [Williamsia sterculiae]|uniref:SalK n=1 Tax=Williamsia sterculiae TaxID=1344003 RepID=A0A1N7CN92_9NOCA|nr:hypothetical protein [Williamsia sterculiae]SIR65109.1 hypothetical protein SAMN05445060_0251 [Williamsia sterculiae]